MHEQPVSSAFDYPIICHAEVDLPSWLKELTGKSGWKLMGEEEDEQYDAFSLRRGADSAEVVLYRSGHATVDVGGEMLYDGQLSFSSAFARLRYYNAENGERVLLN
ncbi:MAG: inhibitor of vertebrate lysozyme family protein [Methylobacillus sp.]|jgi:hypothetical protein|nr:inhibitor of vertebrate lysozyme family protein [Methylobacillus sp.]